MQILIVPIAISLIIRVPDRHARKERLCALSGHRPGGNGVECGVREATGAKEKITSVNGGSSVGESSD